MGMVGKLTLSTGQDVGEDQEHQKALGGPVVWQFLLKNQK